MRDRNNYQNKCHRDRIFSLFKYNIMIPCLQATLKVKSDLDSIKVILLLLLWTKTTEIFVAYLNTVFVYIGMKEDMDPPLQICNLDFNINKHHRRNINV